MWYFGLVQKGVFIYTANYNRNSNLAMCLAVYPLLVSCPKAITIIIIIIKIKKIIMRNIQMYSSLNKAGIFDFKNNYMTVYRYNL